MPRFLPHIVKRGHGPFDHMEGIHAPYAIGSILLHAVGDPPGTITAAHLYRRSLLFAQLLVKLSQVQLSMAIVQPHHAVRVVVHNDGDVLVAFSVACLVYAYVHKSVKALLYVRLDVVKGTRYASPDGLPVYPHVFSHR